MTALSALAAVFLAIALRHLLCRCRRNRQRALNRRRDGLGVLDELRVQSHVEAVGTNRSVSGIDGVNDHAEDCEAGSHAATAKACSTLVINVLTFLLSPR